MRSTSGIRIQKSTLTPLRVCATAEPGIACPLVGSAKNSATNKGALMVERFRSITVICLKSGLSDLAAQLV
jgi:hypothetical protein